MNDDVKLRRVQEQASAHTARIALDHGDAVQALSHIEGATQFWPQNLLIAMSVIGFHSHEKILVEKAYRIFGTQLDLCSNPNGLTQLALWIRNPSRARSIPNRLKVAIDRQRKKLEPDWDEIWVDNGTGPSNRGLAMIRTKRPDDVQDPSDCLNIANQTGNWGPWVNRYISLGGSTENPAYIKLMVAKAVPLSGNPKWHIKGLLRKFTELGDVPEVRRFLRNITLTHHGAAGRSPNTELARHALRLYAKCGRLEHTVDDWVHIARSALFLNERDLAQTAQRMLEKADPDPDVDQLLGQLALENSRDHVSQSARNG